MLCAALVPIVMYASPEWTLKMPAGFREVYGLEKVIPSAEPQPGVQKAPIELPTTPETPARQAATPQWTFSPPDFGDYAHPIQVTPTPGRSYWLCLWGAG